MNVRIRRLGGNSGRSYKNIGAIFVSSPRPILSWIENIGDELVVTFYGNVAIKKEKNDLIITDMVKQ